MFPQTGRRAVALQSIHGVNDNHSRQRSRTLKSSRVLYTRPVSSKTSVLLPVWREPVTTTTGKAFSARSSAASSTMTWKCPTCDLEHDDLPLCFGIDAPWRALVPESEFDQRVELTSDLCVVDEKTFFVRGHIEIPIHGYPEPLAFAVWSSLSEQSFLHMNERWEEADRDADPPYFGWLCSPIPVYPKTIHLKLSVQSRPPGLTPLFTVEPTDHPLAVDQHNGISVERWHQLAHQLLQG